jgi:hypothetical protein
MKKCLSRLLAVGNGVSVVVRNDGYVWADVDIQGRARRGGDADHGDEPGLDGSCEFLPHGQSRGSHPHHHLPVGEFQFDPARFEANGPRDEGRAIVEARGNFLLIDHSLDFKLCISRASIVTRWRLGFLASEGEISGFLPSN